ncbi:nuclear transport factor 2 family protein [Tepidiphilus sp. HLB4]
MSTLSFRPLRRTVLAAAVLLFAGCAGIPSAPEPGSDADRAQLLERARAYWAAIQANDRVTAWSYEEISLDPRWTLQAYLKRGGIVFDEVEVLAVERIEGDTAVVRVRQKYSLPQIHLKGKEATLDDQWKRIDGRWYHAEKRSVMFGD